MRQFRSGDERLAIFEEQKQSGLKIIDYCQQNAISTTTFYGTRARLIGKKTGANPPLSRQLSPSKLSRSWFVYFG